MEQTACATSLSNSQLLAHQHGHPLAVSQVLIISSLLVVLQVEPPITMHPLVVAVAAKFSPEQFLVELRRRTPSQLAEAVLLLLPAQLPEATADRRHWQSLRERLLHLPPAVAVVLRTQLVADSQHHRQGGLVAAAVHGQHRFRMALPDLVAHHAKAAMRKAVALHPNSKQVVAVVAQVAQAQMAQRQMADLVVAAWRHQLLDFPTHMVAVAVAVNEHPLVLQELELTVAETAAKPLLALVAQQTEVVEAAEAAAPEPWWAVLVVQESLSFATPCPTCRHLILMQPMTLAPTRTTSHLQQH
jgi:cytidine deaminase